MKNSVSVSRKSSQFYLCNLSLNLLLVIFYRFLPFFFLKKFYTANLFKLKKNFFLVLLLTINQRISGKIQITATTTMGFAVRMTYAVFFPRIYAGVPL